MRFTGFFLLFSLFLLLSACTFTTSGEYYEQTVSSWRWSRSQDLVRVWGSPDSITALPNGNKVYLYRKEAYKNYPSDSPMTAAGTVTQGRHHFLPQVVPAPNNISALSASGPAFMANCTTFFEVDPQDIIVSVRAQGSDCSGDAAFRKGQSSPSPKNFPPPPPKS